MPKKKLRVGWFTFTCSEDSTILFVELLDRHYDEWKDKLDFRHCKVLQSKNRLDGMDVAFVEGAISSKEEEEKLWQIRALAKKLVAVGACACTGMPSAQRNTFSPEQMERIRPFLEQHALNEEIKPIDAFVKVDEKLHGCPMVPGQFVKLLEKLLFEFGVE